MPDIRDVLNGLDDHHRALYSKIRTSMRREYIICHAATLRAEDWNEDDDRVLDLIDIKVASLFARGGNFDHKQGADDPQGGVIDTKVAEELEQQIRAEAEEKIVQLRKLTPSQQILTDIAKAGNENTNVSAQWPNSANG